MLENTNSPETKDEGRPSIDKIADKLLDTSVGILDDLVEVLYDEAKSGIRKFINWVNAE